MHPVQEACGHKIVCTGVKFKFASMLSKAIPTDSSCYYDSDSGGTRKFFVGASRGQNAYLRGQNF